MKAVSLLKSLAAVAKAPAVSSLLAAAQPQVSWAALKSWSSKFSAASFATSTDVDVVEHTTGAEREEIEANLKGVENPWHEAWLDAPFGTEENPVVVTSELSERIVGCVDPDDDSLVWWGIIEEGQPPKQIVEGGEFFVLKRIPSSGGHH